MPDLGVAASAGRRSMVAGWLSLALHGGVIALAVLLARARVVRTQRRTTHTSIEVVDAVRLPRPAVPPQVAPPSPLAEPRAAAQNRRGRELPQPTSTRPASVKELLADVNVSYDDPSKVTDRPATETPSYRPSQDGLATLQMPGVASASLARPPHSKHDYSKGQMESVRQFAGQTIQVLMTIDTHGHVRRVDLLKGVEPHVDARTIALVRQWEFDPALDDLGKPMPGYVTWDIHLVD